MSRAMGWFMLVMAAITLIIHFDSFDWGDVVAVFYASGWIILYYEKGRRKA